MRLLIALVAAAGAAYFYSRSRRRSRAKGSTTNASDAVDNIHVPHDASTDERLDAGVQETFPASDPVSISPAGETAWERQQRGQRR
jgi:hypothetical protein